MKPRFSFIPPCDSVLPLQLAKDVNDDIARVERDAPLK